MAPLNPHAQPYYMHPHHVQYISYYVIPPPPPPPPQVSLQNNTFYFHSYPLDQYPTKVLPSYFLHHNVVINHGSTSGLNLEVAADETKQVMIIKEEEEEVLVRREASSTTVVKFDKSRLIKKKRTWNVKGHKHPSTTPASDDDFQFNVDLQDSAFMTNKTTVMIKNIPNKLDKKQMLKLVDEHCLMVNRKLQADGDSTGSAFSEFDFFYLPIDFKTGSNYGYAFVNFTTPTAAIRLFQDLHHKSWAHLGSRKVAEVTYARLQGLAKLSEHFNSSIFCCETREYLPVQFTPNRNGFRVFTSQRYIGNYICKQK